MKNRKTKISLISLLHYIKLIYRFGLFAAAVVIFIFSKIKNSGDMFCGFENQYPLLGIIWLVYAGEMASRFFPSKFESMGCQKQFAQNYKPTGKTVPVLQSGWRTFSVAAVWFLLNGIIGALYFADIIDKSILVLISLAYGVCDMICILFFCPFQTWFMKNRCCTVCRIYNWDFPMMFTPFVFIPSVYTYSLLAMSLLLLIRWEFTVHKHPERFSAETNACVSCAECKEKLCCHKKQLKSFIRKLSRDKTK